MTNQPNTQQELPINENTTEKSQSEVLADLERQLRDQAAAVKDLQEKLRLARGTQNKLHIAMSDEELHAKVLELLSRRPRSQDEVATELDEPVGRVNEVMKKVRPKLRNVGSEDRPAWWLVPGNGASNAQLNDAVLALMSHRPMYFRELVDYTGARSDRVAGALGIAVKTKTVIDTANNQVNPRWFLIPPNALSKLR